MYIKGSLTVHLRLIWNRLWSTNTSIRIWLTLSFRSKRELIVAWAFLIRSRLRVMIFIWVGKWDTLGPVKLTRIDNLLGAWTSIKRAVLRAKSSLARRWVLLKIATNLRWWVTKHRFNRCFSQILPCLSTSITSVKLTTVRGSRVFKTSMTWLISELKLSRTTSKMIKMPNYIIGPKKVQFLPKISSL